jgi:hypothetical protein
MAGGAVVVGAEVVLGAVEAVGVEVVVVVDGAEVTDGAGAGRTEWRAPSSETPGSEVGVGWQPTATRETRAKPESIARWSW